MSKDNVKEPDEYENIFDESDIKNNHDAAKIVDVIEDIEVNQNPETQPAEEMIDIDSAYKKESMEPFDEDIEDGIFAPERKVIKSSKKSSSLMWSVSIFAILGVAGFVYFSNPDILSKVSNNLAGESDIILPQETITNSDDVVNPSPLPEINVDTVENTPQVDLVIPEVDNQVVEPIAVQAEQASVEKIGADAIAPQELPVDNTDKIPVENLSTVQVNSAELDKNQSETIDKPLTSEQSEDKETSLIAPEVELKPTLPVNEVITEVKEEKGSQSEILPQATLEESSKVSAPITEVKKDGEEKTLPKDIIKEVDKEIKTEEIVVVNSQEEQKVLDDAKLDKYFDSPNGKMLRDIPAPSMDPKKGSGESIIIVNKRGQENLVRKSSEKLSIEMTSLSQKTVNANRALKLGRFDAAKEMYDELYRLNPKDEGVLSGRALVLQKIGQEDQAISAYEQLLKIYPDNVDAIVNLSGLIRKQYPAVALNRLLDLHMDHPNNAMVTAQLGIAYADAENYSDAIRYLSSAMSMDSKNAQHAYNLAVVLEKSGKPQEAIKNYETALEIDSIFGEGKRSISREKIYDRLSQLRRN